MLLLAPAGALQPTTRRLLTLVTVLGLQLLNELDISLLGVGGGDILLDQLLPGTTLGFALSNKILLALSGNWGVA